MTLPGTRPARRVHVPPPPSGQLPDPGGRDSVERAFRRQQQVSGEYGTFRASIPAGVDPDELRDSAGIFAYSDAALTLQPALDAVSADVDTVNQMLAAASKGAGVPDDQTGQASRIWARAKDRLDKAKTQSQKVTVARQLIAGAEGLTLAVYQDELPFYAETEGMPGDWLPGALAARTPGGAELVSSATRLAKAHAILQHNHASLQRSMAKNVAPPTLLDPSTLATDTPYSDVATATLSPGGG
jgi:hypothetical protein